MKENRYFILALVLYLILQFLHFTNSGFNTVDEYIIGRGVLGAIVNDHELIAPLPDIKILGHWFPLTISYYQGGVEYYFFLPFFLIFGSTCFSLKISFIAIGLLILFFTYLFTKEFLNSEVAIISVILLICDLNFMLMPRMGVNINALLQVWFMAFLFFIYKWRTTRGNYYLYISMFMCGLAMSTRTQFICLLNALAIYGLFIEKLNKIKQRFNIVKFISALFFFCLGSLSMIIFNISNNFLTLKYVASCFKISGGGIHNLAYINNIIFRFQQLKVLLDGSWILNSLYSQKLLSIKLFNILYTPMLIFSLTWLAIAVLFLRNRHLCFSPKKNAFILLATVIIFLQSPITVSVFNNTHLFILFPLIQITIAMSLYEFIQFFRKIKLIKVLAIFFLLGVIFYNLSLFALYRTALLKNGETGQASKAGYELCDWLLKEKLFSPIILDAVVGKQLRFLSKGKISPEGSDFVEANVTREARLKLLEDFDNNICKQLSNNENIYIFFHESSNDLNNFYLFSEIAKRFDKKMIKIKEFCQDNGEAVYEAYKVY